MRLKTLLNAQLADVIGAAVIALVFTFFDAFFFALVDAPDVTHHMAAQLAIRVAAKQTGLDVHTRKPETLGRKTRHFFVGQARADRQGLETLGVFAQLFKAPFVTWLNVDELTQRLDGRFNIEHLRGHDFERVGRVIGGQHHAIAVQDQATVGHDGNNRRAVALRLLT